mmetsp:Transcript_29288/g.113560  ORF Transcript_29288/g.113560 Transcript_29288/m.113560 type:complete len:91 (+) Transcript_29288:61-333(+)
MLHDFGKELDEEVEGPSTSQILSGGTHASGISLAPNGNCYSQNRRRGMKVRQRFIRLRVSVPTTLRASPSEPLVKEIVVACALAEEECIN